MSLEYRDDNSQWQFEQEMEERFEKDFKEFVASHEKDYQQEVKND